MNRDTDLRSIASGFAGRTLATARLVGKVGLRALGKTLRPDRPESEPTDAEEAQAKSSAEKLVSELNQLKGLMMKFGQMASYLDGALPPAAQKVLSQLQAESTPMAPDVIAAVVAADLGAAPEALFDTFEPRPFAAASIGQVHRATLDGRQVAVKIQYPGIEKALMSDVRALSAVGRLSTMMMPMSGKALVDELRQRMAEECDYTAEARHQTLFGGLLRDLEGVAVPEVVQGRSARRVLTTDFHRGAAFYAFKAEGSAEARDRAGERIFDVVFRCIFEHCVFNADPHPGNYLFGPGGEVVLLDFGCVKRYDATFVDAWKRVALSVLDNDKARFIRAYPDTGLVGRPKGFDWDHQWEVMQYLYEPFLAPQPYVFTHEYVRRSYDLMVWKNPNKYRTGMPPDWLFANRLQWGLNSVLAHIGARGRWRDLWRRSLEAETRPAW